MKKNGVGELVKQAKSGKGFVAGTSLRSASAMLASDITPRALDPVWPGVLWAGKPTLLAGDPGLGKSMVTCDIVARVTTGMPWPCSVERRQPADVVMLSAEDDPEDTIVPRLIAAGADLTRVHIVRGIVEQTDSGPRERWLSLESHVPELGALLASLEGRVRLVVIDPLSAYLGRDVDSHNEGDVRSVLAQLAALAAEYRAAVLAVRHLRKSETASAQAKIIGSIAFTAAARAVYVVARDPTDDDRRLVLCAKNNLAPETAGYSYEIAVTSQGIPFISWGDDREVRTADEIIGGSAGSGRPVDEAESWLRDALSEGPVPVGRMKDMAEDLGLAPRTLDRARARLGVVSERQSRGNAGAGGWQWRLPGPKGATRKNATPATDSGVLARDGASSTFTGTSEAQERHIPIKGVLAPSNPGQKKQ